MPVYDYVCHDCHKTFEVILTLKEHEVDAKCPKCGSKNVEQKATAFYAVTGKKSWCVAELNQEYLRRMEEVLALYEKPLSEKQPVVCIDEKPAVLHQDVRPPDR